MLKSILVGLDGSDDGRAALELGLSWAGRFGAKVVGLAVVDEPGIHGSADVLLAGGHAWHTAAAAPLLSRSRQQSKDLLEDFARRCKAARVAGRALDEAGTPYVRILAEAQACDIVLLGQRTHFDFGGGEPDETLGKVIRDSPRPVVAVPAGPAPRGGAVIVAYDGSLQASRALYAFEASGLGGGRKVHVVSLAPEGKEAAGHAARAREFLGNHGIEAHTHATTFPTVPAEFLLRQVRRLEASLLVMGAYGQPALREFFLGSTTRELLRSSPVPVFCHY